MHLYPFTLINCNALLFGLPKYQLDCLQKVQNAAARVILQLSKVVHITPAFVDLHWLPTKFRVQFRLFLILLLSTSLNITKLQIILMIFCPWKPNLSILNCTMFGGNTFTHAAPVLWNSLPLTIRTISCTSIFKKRLKTFLFKKAFYLWSLYLMFPCF